MKVLSRLMQFHPINVWCIKLFLHIPLIFKNIIIKHFYTSLHFEELNRRQDKISAEQIFASDQSN